MIFRRSLQPLLRSQRPAFLRRAVLFRPFAAANSASGDVALPPLPYAYDALEPNISASIMEIHHSKHHQAYVTNFNAALEQYRVASTAKDHTRMIALQPALRFNGGGHINHSIFWSNLAPAGNGGGGEPAGALLNSITEKWGSFDAFKADFSAQAAGVQGSGWAWLGSDAKGNIEIITKPNQDPLTERIPLLGIDVWEHAYYLQYKNVRPDYLKAIWGVVNWGNVAERYAAAMK